MEPSWGTLPGSASSPGLGSPRHSLCSGEQSAALQDALQDCPCAT